MFSASELLASVLIGGIGAILGVVGIGGSAYTRSVLSEVRKETAIAWKTGGSTKRSRG